MHIGNYFNSCAGGKIYAYRWEPKRSPCAVVQILHGLADYAERYDDFASHLTDMGFLVVAEDHMGHGRSVGDNGIKGYFTGGWFDAVEDAYQLLLRTKQEFPEIPYILFGHSMGSFMTQTILQEHPECPVSACILCGSGWQPEMVLSTGKRLCEASCRIYGETNVSPRLMKLAFGAYNIRIEHFRTPYDWVCRKSSVVDALMEDPLCAHSVTCGLMRDMLQGIRYIQNPENLLRLNKCLPVLLVSGGDDPVGLFGEGVKLLEKKLLSAGVISVTTRIYPLCRHEILNEINKDEIYRDICKWILSVCDI